MCAAAVPGACAPAIWSQVGHQLRVTRLVSLGLDYQSCNMNALSCPPDFLCLNPVNYQFSTSSIGYCCRTSARCPNAPYLATPKPCAIGFALIMGGIATDCDVGFSCQPSTVASVTLCCPAVSQLFTTCPNGQPVCCCSCVTHHTAIHTHDRRSSAVLRSVSHHSIPRVQRPSVSVDVSVRGRVGQPGPVCVRLLLTIAATSAVRW